MLPSLRCHVSQFCHRDCSCNFGGDGFPVSTSDSIYFYTASCFNGIYKSCNPPLSPFNKGGVGDFRGNGGISDRTFFNDGCFPYTRTAGNKHVFEHNKGVL